MGRGKGTPNSVVKDGCTLTKIPTLEQHLQDVQEVLSILRDEKLYVKVSKCAFGDGLPRLRVMAAGVAVDSHKVMAGVAKSVFQSRFTLINLTLQLLSPIRRRVRRHCGSTDALVGIPCGLILGNDRASEL